MVADEPFDDVSAAPNFPHRSCLRVNIRARLGNLAGLLFHPDSQRFVLRELLLGGVFSHVFGNLHAAEVGAAHAAEMRGLGALLRQGLTKLLPIIFALFGLAVDSSLCRLIPITSIRRETLWKAREQNS